MKKEYILLLLTIFSITGSVIGANHQKKYNQKAIKDLQSVVQTISRHGYLLKGRKQASRVISCVRNGANPNVPGVKGTPLLSNYVEWGNKKVVESLLDHNADIEINSPHGTPLFYANTPSMIRLLRSKGAHVLHRTSHWGTSQVYENSALHHAAYQHKSAHVLASLCQAGLDKAVNMESNGANVMSILITNGKWGREHMKKIGVITRYGGDIEHISQRAKRDLDADPEYAYRLRKFITKVSDQRESAARFLASILNGPISLNCIIASYWRPQLTGSDIDGWDELIKDIDEKKD